MQRYLRIKRFIGVAAFSTGFFLALAHQPSPLLEAQSTGTATLIVHVTGARHAKGKIRAALFSGGEGFPNDASKAIQTQAADIDPQTSSAQIVFTNVPEGDYAVSVFHDENMNQKLDKPRPRVKPRTNSTLPPANCSRLVVGPQFSAPEGRRFWLGHRNS